LEASVCRHATTRLPAEPGSALAARQFVEAMLGAWTMLELLDAAQLATSELVTNAILHAGPPLSVSVSTENGTVEIAVFDGSATLPTVRPVRPDLAGDLACAVAAEAALGTTVDDRDPRVHVGVSGSIAGGRGLLLIDAIIGEWGATRLGDGKAVWIRTPVPGGWAHAARCPCSGSTGVTLASGRPVVHVAT
jgi:hypothetical protein